MNDDKLKDLDKKLQELALTDFNQFCQLTGVDKIKAFVCIERAKGLTFQQIANKLGVSRQTIWKRCKKCKPSD